MLQGLSYFPVSLYIATFAKDLSNQLTATNVLSLFNLSAVAGQIIIGHLSDAMPYPFVMLLSAIGSSLSAFLLWGFASRAIHLYFFAVVFGCLVSIHVLFSGASQYASRPHGPLSPVERGVLVDLDARRRRVRREQARAHRLCMDGDIVRQGYFCRRRADRLRVPFAVWPRVGDGPRLRQVRVWRGRTFRWVLCAGVWRWEPCHRAH